MTKAPLMKPRVFIGSSREHIDHARAVQNNLDSDVESRVWDQEIFRISQYPLEVFATELQQADFGVFIFAPEDLVRLRGKWVQATRDNVIFEAGLFVGKLGRNRTFLITPTGSDKFHLPTDLAGLTVGRFDPNPSDGNWTAALGPACNRLRTEIKRRWPEVMKQRSGITTHGMFTDYFPEFATLIAGATSITLYFIHSRRWRENHHDQLQAFLQKSGTTLQAHLPDLANLALIQSIMGHFDDGPAIPGFICDAYRYFLMLAKAHPGRVTIRLTQVYPTYSFYRFDRTFVVALYPTTPIRKDVPTFRVVQESTFGQFLLQDIDELEKSRQLTEAMFPKLATLVSSYGRRLEPSTSQ